MPTLGVLGTFIAGHPLAEDSQPIRMLPSRTNSFLQPTGLLNISVLIVYSDALCCHPLDFGLDVLLRIG